MPGERIDQFIVRDNYSGHLNCHCSSKCSTQVSILQYEIILGITYCHCSSKCCAQVSILNPPTVEQFAITRNSPEVRWWHAEVRADTACLAFECKWISAVLPNNTHTRCCDATFSGAAESVCKWSPYLFI